jgi:hypothetical protein
MKIKQILPDTFTAKLFFFTLKVKTWKEKEKKSFESGF